jgi:hypothetical protein
MPDYEQNAERERRKAAQDDLRGPDLLGQLAALGGRSAKRNRGLGIRRIDNQADISAV